jgi:hypothetical protein
MNKTKYNMEQLEALVVNWAKERKIIPNATSESQLLKAVSEMGELADATLKGQDAEMQDAIGDVVVCLINLCALYEGWAFYTYVYMLNSLDYEWRSHLRFSTPGAQVTAAVSEMGKVAGYHVNGLYMGMVDPIGDVTVCLHNLCILKGWTLEECVEKAWEQIKDRKGTLLENGCFVKEEAK